MADELDEFGLDDDPLDGLPANALNELERDALLLTQCPHPASIWQQNVHKRAPSDYGFDDNDDDIINLDEQPPEVQRAYDKWSQHQRIVDIVPTALAQETGNEGEAEGHPQADLVELQARVLQASPTRHHYAPFDAYPLSLYSWKASAPASNAWSKKQGLRQS